MKGVVIFLVLTLVLFMAEPVEPRFRSSFRNGLQRFRGKATTLREHKWHNAFKRPVIYNAAFLNKPQQTHQLFLCSLLHSVSAR
uniref:Uncharacterized protein n=1 Tax=Maylandia zebra TaxID=106582 RepID=A0A3P9BBH8_9CICH